MRLWGEKGIARLSAVALRAFLLPAILLAVASCGSVPITDRQQLSLLPDSEMNVLGLQAYRKILRKSTVVRETRDARLVQTVGNNIKTAVETYFRKKGEGDRLSGYEWEFSLIRNKQSNAFCLPGGKVAVYTGILKATQSEAGLAVVMGHEVAHAIASHGNERMSQTLLIGVIGSAMGAAISKDNPKTRDAFAAAFGIGASLAVLLPFSRMHESEADRLGLIFMAMAGYDPQEAPRFWRRMAAAKDGGGASLEFLSTHPSNETRISDLEYELAEAMPYFRGTHSQKGEPPSERNAPEAVQGDGQRTRPVVVDGEDEEEDGGGEEDDDDDDDEEEEEEEEEE